MARELMPLLIVRLKVPDLQELQQKFSERIALKESYGCTSSRLLVDTQEPNAAVVLMDFESLEAARAYIGKSASLLGAGELLAMTKLTVEFLEDAPSAVSPIPS